MPSLRRFILRAPLIGEAVLRNMTRQELVELIEARELPNTVIETMIDRALANPAGVVHDGPESFGAADFAQVVLEHGQLQDMDFARLVAFGVTRWGTRLSQEACERAISTLPEISIPLAQSGKPEAVAAAERSLAVGVIPAEYAEALEMALLPPSVTPERPRFSESTIEQTQEAETPVPQPRGPSVRIS